MIVHKSAVPRLQALANYDGVDIATILAAFYDRVEISSRLWDKPVVISLANGGAAADGTSDALLTEIQPALVFKGNAGTFTIAPKGMPTGISKLVNQFGLAGGALMGGVALLFLGIGFGIGYYVDATK